MSEELHPALHPDADVLSGFLEGVLPEHERTACLNHLAECAQCREVVYVARKAASVDAAAAGAVTRVAERHWFRPLTVAAAVAMAITIVFSIGLYRMIRSAEPQVQVTASAKRPIETVAEAEAVHPPPETRPAPGKVSPRSVPVGREHAPTVPAAPPVGSPAEPAPGPAAPEPLNVVNGIPAPAASPLAPVAAPRAAIARFSAVPEAAGIAGKVSDPTGAAIARAQIEVKNESTGATYSSTSDARGEFSLAGMLPGKYDLSISQPGFKKFVEPSIDLQPQMVARVDSILEVGTVAETVTVNAQAPLLKTESGEFARAAARADATALPLNGRRVKLLPLRPAFTLPDKSNPVSFANKDRIVVAVNAAGALFRSEDGGERWKQVRGKWRGRVVHVAVNSKTDFELTTDPASTWLSADGRHWSNAPTPH